MKSLMILVVLLTSVSSFARPVYPECADSIGRSNVVDAKDDLARLVSSKDDSAQLAALILSNNKATNASQIENYLQYLAYSALTNNRSALEAQVEGECNRPAARANLQAAGEIISGLRKQLAAAQPK